MLEAQESAMRLLATIEENHIVAILDISEATSSIYDLSISAVRQLIQADKDKTIGFVLVGASQGAKLAANIFKRASNINLVYTDDITYAPTIAHKMLDAYANK